MTALTPIGCNWYELTDQKKPADDAYPRTRCYGGVRSGYHMLYCSKCELGSRGKGYNISIKVSQSFGQKRLKFT